MIFKQNASEIFQLLINYSEVIISAV
jgi:hypothetical protein